MTRSRRNDQGRGVLQEGSGSQQPPAAGRRGQSGLGGWVRHWCGGSWYKVSSVFETFDHTADLGLRAVADDREGMFAEAARGLTSLLIEEPGALRSDNRFDMPVVGVDLELLLFDLLNELLFQFETTGFLGRDFSVTSTETGLAVEAYGEVIADQPDRLAREIKAITYHGLKVQQQAGRWMAEVIVDI